MKEYKTRLKDVCISQKTLRDLVLGKVALRLRNKLPNDVTICSIHTCYARNCFLVRLESPDFEPVPFGQEIPVDDDIELFYVEPFSG